MLHKLSNIIYVTLLNLAEIESKWTVKANLKTASGATATRNGIVDQIKKLYSVQMVCVRMHDDHGHELSEGELYVQNEICNTTGNSVHFVSERFTFR